MNKCNYCGNPMERNINNRRCKNKYCSKACSNKRRSRPIAVICGFCGASLKRRPFQLRNPNRVHYCNRICKANGTRGIFKIKNPALQRLFYSYRNGARRRNLNFEISFDEFGKITKRNCFYCGRSPQAKAHSQSGDIYIYNGIDRWDNSLSYTWDNIVTCCFACNQMKGILSGDNFLQKIKHINERFGEIMKGQHITIYPVMGHIPMISSIGK